MKPRMIGRFLMAAALLTSAGIASASTKAPAGPPTDADIGKAVNHAILTYPQYTLWDAIGYRVSGGEVELSGVVTQPYKKEDIERTVQKIAGVTSVSDGIKVLPNSLNDDRLRVQVARAIYRDPVLLPSTKALLPIHIIVDNGQVTLCGVVNSTLEKQIAGVRASTAGLSFGPVTNNLVVENPPKKS